MFAAAAASLLPRWLFLQPSQALHSNLLWKRVPASAPHSWHLASGLMLAFACLACGQSPPTTDLCSPALCPL
eukprot:9505582-Prorocentrum_lima.AAC.1